ncbi:MAG: Polysaccharide deacetylase, partial [Anaeromyxobacteraceae bacterium]|nr:Polysaccharide deacetylase [Anaeromyxobacteraceae bacterium]
MMISWEALREMRQSGLVEVGSHSWDLHRGIVANPQGNLQPAATSRRWLPEQKRHEDEASYRRRIEADLSRSVTEIRKRTGKAPRVITWPYGRYNATTAAVAERLGFQVGLTLLDGANGPDTPLLALRRLIVDRELTLPGFAGELEEREEDVSDEDRPQSIVHVDLDAVYDADPAQQERNLSHLLDRLQWLNVNTVYLQAFADPDANGSADAVYFPSRRLPMRADLFNRVAWQIRTRTQVRRLYAPGSVEAIRASDDLVGRWTIFKINALDDFAMELAAIVRREQPGLVVARNLYAQVVLQPRAEVWYAQALDNSLARYDFTAIMAMPYMENAPDPGAFYRDLVAEVKARGAMKKVVFELQAVDWRHDSKPIPSDQLAETIRTLFDLGVQHVGYYPDTPMKNLPDPAVIRRVLSQRPEPPRAVR